jgi:hypothetical protein
MSVWYYQNSCSIGVAVINNLFRILKYLLVSMIENCLFELIEVVLCVSSKIPKSIDSSDLYAFANLCALWYVLNKEKLQCSSETIQIPDIIELDDEELYQDANRKIFVIEIRGRHDGLRNLLMNISNTLKIMRLFP